MKGFRFVDISYSTTYPDFLERKSIMDNIEKQFGERPSFFVRQATHPDPRSKYSKNYTPEAQWIRIISLV